MGYFNSGINTERKDNGFGRKFYGKYRAIVSNNKDTDDKMGRIKVKCPAVLGEDESNWCNPCTPYAGDKVGHYFIPNVGDSVWVEFEGGNPDLPIWVGNWWGEKKTNDEVYKKVGSHHLIKTKTATVYWNDEDSQLSCYVEEVKIVLDGKKHTALIQAKGNIDVKSDAIINITAKGNINIKSDANINMTASANINAKGSTINLN